MVDNKTKDNRFLEEGIIKTIRYFRRFSYRPFLGELHIFLPGETSKDRLLKEINRLSEKKILYFDKHSKRVGFSEKYTVGEYGIVKSQTKNYKLQNLARRQAESKNKLKKIRFYIKSLSMFPQIKLIGLSGSMAMMNAGYDDDIDLFIITAKNRLFSGRFIALLLGQVLGIRRKRQSTARKSLRVGFKDKVCLNLFFDENDLTVPEHKKNLYIAHEILQMKPLINKNQTYERFLEANKWIYDLFPNAKITNKLQIANKSRSLLGIWNFIGDVVEWLLKQAQLILINHHRTTEIITNTQLWFFPDDFEGKLNALQAV